MKAPLENRIGCGLTGGTHGPRGYGAAGARRKIAAPAIKSQTRNRRSSARALASLLLLLAAAPPACTLFPAPQPLLLDYSVVLVGDGIDVQVTVAGGPRPAAWVGFGVSPLGANLSSREIYGVSARTVGGAPLAVQPAGEDAYRVDVTTDEAWIFAYHARIGAPPADFYHRASSASADHIVLVGVDILPRVFGAGDDVALPPEDRPLEEVAEATIHFDTASLPAGWVVASAAPEKAHNQFTLREHPARSAFAIGPYRFEEVDDELGLRAAIHADWNIARDVLVTYAHRLARVQAQEFGPPPGDPALMIFTPLPASARPVGGVRSAGMVWDRTLLLFAGADPTLPLDSTRVREMMAIFLGHELFHLYVPWGLAITQPLSWLSEGWAEHVGRTSARQALILSAAGEDRSLREAYNRYLEMGGARAGSLQNAAEYGGEELRPLLYVRGELVFRVLSLEWEDKGKQGSFDGVLWQRLLLEYDGSTPLEPAAVSRVLSAMVSPSTVRRLVDGSAVITLPELRLGRR
ncbi:MAG: hypothetical protein PVJ49_19170 [Acidobacteriota bacterium]|jgi:hypothetical protein